MYKEFSANTFFTVLYYERHFFSLFSSPILAYYKFQRANYSNVSVDHANACMTVAIFFWHVFI